MTSMTAVINAAGWSKWSSSAPQTDHVTFGIYLHDHGCTAESVLILCDAVEYDNTGAGASGTRASFAKKLSAAIPITQILGSSWASLNFVDKAYLS